MDLGRIDVILRNQKEKLTERMTAREGVLEV